jgi:hypothetical protein
VPAAGAFKLSAADQAIVRKAQAIRRKRQSAGKPLQPAREPKARPGRL